MFPIRVLNTQNQGNQRTTRNPDRALIKIPVRERADRNRKAWWVIVSLCSLTFSWLILEQRTLLSAARSEGHNHTEGLKDKLREERCKRGFTSPVSELTLPEVCCSLNTTSGTEHLYKMYECLQQYYKILKKKHKRTTFMNYIKVLRNAIEEPWSKWFL